jgi:hypothetical protein
MKKKINSEIKRSKIDSKTVAHLWGISAGRCEMCNQLLHIDPTFGVEGNFSQNAHIHAVGQEGPRHKDNLTKEEINKHENLMLLCPQHHKMIDSDPQFFESGYLKNVKEEHENRILTVTSIRKGQVTRMVSYIASIDGYCPEHSSLLFRQAVVRNNQYPQQYGVIELNNSKADYEPTQEYYQIRADELSKSVRERIKIITEEEVISLFPFGLQPLLIKLGTLLSDQNNITVYQCHRSGHKWEWPSCDSAVPKFFTIRPSNNKAENIALVIDLSAKVSDDRIKAVLGNEIPIWHLTLETPNREFVTSIAVQDSFYKEFRLFFESIKDKVPMCKLVHLFPVMPTSLNVRLGMDYRHKTDLPMLIYDNDNAKGGFFPTITIGGLNVY